LFGKRTRRGEKKIHPLWGRERNDPRLTIKKVKKYEGEGGVEDGI